MQQADVDALVEWLASVQDDPYSFVLGAYPWGEGELSDKSGPYEWQADLLRRVRDKLISVTAAIQEAIASGHGIGKSALVSWLLDWAQSTMVDTKGIVTANTGDQLKTKTWAEFAKWHRLSMTSSLFEMTATARYSRDPLHEKTWRIDSLTWNEQRPEAFAGMHNAGKRIIIIFDEASAIASVIWETVEGALTDKDTQILWFAFGNPTLNTGRFNQCFTDEKLMKYWETTKVDSRSVPGTNKEQFTRWAEMYGEDSDFFRVRVRGEFPRSSVTQLIPVDNILRAMSNEPVSYTWEPLILGVDVARFGSNESVLQYRRGREARSIQTERFRGLPLDQLADHVAASMVANQPDAVFIDEGGVGGGVIDILRRLGHSVLGVNFGSKAATRPNGTLVANKRAEMYVQLRDWIAGECSIPKDEELRQQLTAIDYFFNQREELQLEAKVDMESRGVQSPDWADALALTFAFPVNHRQRWMQPKLKQDYDPYSDTALKEYADA